MAAKRGPRLPNDDYAADVAETAQKLSYDIEYIDRFGPKIDLLILWKTLCVYLNPNYVR